MPVYEDGVAEKVKVDAVQSSSSNWVAGTSRYMIEWDSIFTTALDCMLVTGNKSSVHKDRIYTKARGVPVLTLTPITYNSNI